MRITDSNKRPGSKAGYTMIEIMSVFAVVMVMSAVAFPVIQSTLRAQRLENAMDLVTLELRRARQEAVDRRRTHEVRLSTNTIIMRRQDSPGIWTQINEVYLPDGVVFAVPSGAPSGQATPDGLGASAAVDFNGSDTVFFQPDGSARDATGQLANGVVYVSRTDYTSKGSAVTLFGATGRIRPWHLYETTETAGVEWR